MRLFALTSLPLLLRAATAGFFVFVIRFPQHRIVVFARGKRCDDSILSQAGFNKTTERNRRQRRSQCESNFRRHAGDETGLSHCVQAF